MRANEFVKEFGLDKTKCIIKDFENGKYKSCCIDSGLINNLEKSWWDVCVYDLKRLVESHELVKNHNGISPCKFWVSMMDGCDAYQNKVDLFKRAIADVESCL